MPASNKPWDKVKRAKRGRPANDGTRWTPDELKALRRLARKATVDTVAKTLNRTPPSVQQQAMRQGVSFR